MGLCLRRRCGRECPAQPGVQDGFELGGGELLEVPALGLVLGVLLGLDDPVPVPVPDADALEVGGVGVGVGVGVGHGGFTATVRVIVVDGS